MLTIEIRKPIDPCGGPSVWVGNPAWPDAEDWGDAVELAESAAGEVFRRLGAPTGVTGLKPVCVSVAGTGCEVDYAWMFGDRRARLSPEPGIKASAHDRAGDLWLVPLRPPLGNLGRVTFINVA